MNELPDPIVAALALANALAEGCTCAPDIELEHADDIVTGIPAVIAHIRHDDDCPLANAGYGTPHLYQVEERHDPRNN